MWLWQFLKASVYDPAFHGSMKDRSFGSVFGYFALVVFAVSVIVSFPALRGVYAFVFQPSETVDAIRQQALDLYPDWLELKAENGKISMNAESPFAIAMPRGTSGEGEESLPANLLVINTDKPIDTSDFEKYDTLLILSEDMIGAIDEEKGKVEIQEIGQYLEDGEFALVKDEYAAFVSKVEGMIKGFGILLLFLIPITVFVGLSISYLVYLLFGALVIWLAAALRKTKWEYGTAYKSGLVLIAVPALYSALVTAGAIGEIPVRFFFTVLLFVLALANIPSGQGAALVEESVPAPAETPIAPTDTK